MDFFVINCTRAILLQAGEGFAGPIEGESSDEDDDGDNDNDEGRGRARARAKACPSRAERAARAEA